MNIEFVPKIFNWNNPKTFHKYLVIAKDGFLVSKVQGPKEIELYNVFTDKTEKKEGYERVTTFYKIGLRPFISKSTLKTSFNEFPNFI